MLKNTLLPAVALGLAAAPAAAQISFSEILTIDLDSTANDLNPEFIGTNPSAMAWDGFDLYVAGFNNGAAPSTGIVKVTDAFGAATLGTAFGVQIGTPGSRGYSGLDFAGGTLCAAYDDGAVDPQGITAYDTAGTQLWAASARGGSGCGFDPDFPGGSGGAGVAWTTFGSGRRALQDTATGANLFTTGDGMIITPDFMGSFWRDFDFDDDTGDLWARRSNDVVHCTRTGSNSCTAGFGVDNMENGAFQAGQTIAYLNTGFGDVVIYNDRTGGGTGQDFATVVQVIDPSGAAAAVDWNGFSPATGNGWYDFSWDANSSTLAILDFANRNVHIFEVSPPPVVPDLFLMEVAVVNLDSTATDTNPEFVGTNPSAVAWDGTDAYIAGFNNGAAPNVGIVKVSDVLGLQSFGSAFGVQVGTPGSRGYSGLDVSGGTLSAAFDDGAVDPQGITAYDGSGAQLWAASARGGSGCGFDPDFPGGSGGAGVAWTTFGSGRRALQDSATGANLFTTGDGMIITPDFEGSFWRDMDFDEDTGDLWARRSNDVVRCVRTGSNACSSSLAVENNENGPFINGQNIAYLNRCGQDAVIYNDRTSTSSGQDFFAVTKVIDGAGNELLVDWGGFSPSSGTGYYDYSWDASTGTLAILDFANRNLHVFFVDPGQTTTSLCFGDGTGTACPCGNDDVANPGTGGCLNSAGTGAVLSTNGQTDPNDNTLEFNVTGATPNTFAILVSGDNALGGGLGILGLPAADGLRCVGGNALRHGTRGLDGSGSNLDPFGSFTGPPGGIIGGAGFSVGQTRYFQVRYREDPMAGPCGNDQNTSQAIEVCFAPTFSFKDKK